LSFDNGLIYWCTLFTLPPHAEESAFVLLDFVLCTIKAVLVFFEKLILHLLYHLVFRCKLDGTFGRIVINKFHLRESSDRLKVISRLLHEGTFLSNEPTYSCIVDLKSALFKLIKQGFNFSFIFGRHSMILGFRFVVSKSIILSHIIT
jgi:hypothetical protein